MLQRFLVVAAAMMALAPAGAAQSDLEDLMARALARREQGWKQLQQYVLDEQESFQILANGALPIYGFRHEYVWFPRDGVFIRSPLRANGVEIDEATRAREESRFLERERRRERRRAERAAAETPEASAEKNISEASPAGPAPAAEAVAQTLEPQFVSAAYFLRFKFDAGQYALVGRETFDGRETLKVEYYPKTLFTEGRTRPNRQLRERDARVQEKMNKTSLVTFWVDPALSQILGYEFENVDMDFLPGRAFMRINGISASMRMGEPFPGVWLPRLVEMRFDLGTAAGEFDGRYRVEYHDYRLASVTTKVR